MSCVLRMLGIAAIGELDLDGPPRYLVTFDVDYRPHVTSPVTGVAVFSDDLAKAMRFPDAAAALKAWQSCSTVVPTRLDGRPNKPLTAYSMTIEEVA